MDVAPAVRDPQLLQRGQDVRRGLEGLVVVPVVGGVEVGFLPDAAGEGGAFDDGVDEPVAFADEVVEVLRVVAFAEGMRRGVGGGDVVGDGGLRGHVARRLRDWVLFVLVDGMSRVMGKCGTE